MTTHELKYCRVLLRCIKDLYIERAALSVILDTAKFSKGLDQSQWRDSRDQMTNDCVYRSAVEANFAPHFEQMEWALKDDQALLRLLDSPPWLNRSAPTSA
jgi:hypothetical protein